MPNSSVKAKVEALIGEIGSNDTTIVSEWASDTAREVINILPEDMLWSVSTELTDDGTGTDVSTSKFLYAHKDGYEAIEISPSMKGRASDVGSIYKATDTSSVYYREGGSVTILPTGGKIAVVSFPNILYDDSDVTGVPDDVKHLVIMGTAVKGRLNQLNDLRVAIKDISNPDYVIPTMTFDASPNIADLVISANVPSLTLSAAPSITPLSIVASPPTAPASPVFTYVDVNDSATIAATTITEPSQSSSYVSPTMTMESAPIISSLSTTSVRPTPPSLSDNSVTFNFSSPTYVKPTFDTINFPTLNWDNLSSPIEPSLAVTSVGALGTNAPSYSAPVIAIGTFPSLNWDVGALPVCPYYNWDTIDEVLSSMVIPSNIVLPSLSIDVAPILTWDMPSLPITPTISEKVVADFSASYPNFLPPVMDTPNWSDTNTWISTEEDNEMLAARVQEIQAKIAEYSARLQESQGAFNKDNAIFQAIVQEKIQEAQLADATVAKTIQLYQNDISKYTAKVNAVIQENQSQLQVWQIEWSTKLQKYQADLGVVVSKYQAEIAGENQVSQSKIAVRANQLQEDSTKNTMSIQTFQAKVALFQADVASVTQVNQGRIAAWQQETAFKVQVYSSDIQNALNSFNKEKEEYQASLQIAIQNAQLESKGSAEELQKHSIEVQKYSAEVNSKTSLNQGEIAAWQQESSLGIQKYQANIQNELNKFNQENSAFQADLQVSIQNAQLSSTDDSQAIQKYSSELQAYQADMNTEIQEYTQNFQKDFQLWQAERQTDLQKYTTDIQNSLNSFNSSNVEFQASVQYAMENARMKQERIVSELQGQQDAAKQNSLQKLQREVQQYTNDLGKYGSEVQDYQARVSTEIQEWTTNNLQHSLAKWNTERSTEIQKYSTDLEKFKAESQNEQQVYAINEIQKEIQLYSSDQANKLGKFQSDIQNSTQRFQSEFGVYTKKTDSEFQKHQTMMQELQLLQQQYQQGLQMFIQSYTAPKGVEENGK
jgi:hypothetical protein